MIMENNGLKGIKSDLSHLDAVASKLGFVRWQWEYFRATYDYKIIEVPHKEEYYLRVNARATEGKLEDPDAILVVEDSYLGLASFPHGLDYSAPIPDHVKQAAEKKMDELKSRLSD